MNLLVNFFHLLNLPFYSELKLTVTRVFPFESFYQGKRLESSTLETWHQVPTKTLCVFLCTRNLKCVSFNYCFPGSCELITEVLPSNLPSDYVNCVHQTIKREAVPTCVEGNSEKNIKDDEDPGVCEINQKRRDAHWGQWQEMVELDTEEDFKSIYRAEWIPPAHGGQDKPHFDNGTIILEWLKFIHGLHKFSEAEATCHALQGDLFYNLNGLKAQLEFFFYKLKDWKCFWTGIWRDWEDGGKWKTPNGGEISADKIVWGGGQPNNLASQGAVNVLGWQVNGIDYLHDDPKDFQSCAAVCQLV